MFRIIIYYTYDNMVVQSYLEDRLARGEAERQEHAPPPETLNPKYNIVCYLLHYITVYYAILL